MSFSRRATQLEQMDASCAYADLRDCLRDLAAVNRFTRAYRPTLHWLHNAVSSAPSSQSLHLLDVGCGGGDMLRRIEHWAMRNHISIRLTGVDISPATICIAREFTSPASEIHWLAGGFASGQLDLGAVDFIVSSLFTHHLSDIQIVNFISWMEVTARQGWFISDLYRSRVSWIAFKALALGARWHPMVRHDGPLSIRRAFRPEEWRCFVRSAGVPEASLRITASWPARIYVARRK